MQVVVQSFVSALERPLHWLLGSLSKDDGNRNDDTRKQ